jgi:hypothetical protein
MAQKTNQKWISLKEAAKISGYSPDYIGYLIRTGKISGKQVHFNIAWRTTAEAVLNYKQREQKREQAQSGFGKILGFFQDIKEKILWELKLLKLFTKTFKYVLPIIIILILTFSALIFFVLSLKFQKSIPESKQTIEEIKKEESGQPFLTY